MKDCLSFLAALGILVVLVIGILFACYWVTPYLPAMPPTPDPLDIYEDAINRCQMRETLSDEECQAAALREAYPTGD